jgi:hypothetical protein
MREVDEEEQELLTKSELERIPSKSPHLQSIKFYRTDNRIRIADASPTPPRMASNIINSPTKSPSCTTIP